MAYPDDLKTAALDRETARRPHVARRGLNAAEEAALLEISNTILQIGKLYDMAHQFDYSGGDGDEYLKSIYLDGLGYCGMLRREIKAIPEREAKTEAARLTDDQNEAGRECER